MPGDDVEIPGVNDSDLAAVTRELLSTPDLHANKIDRFFGQVQAIVEARAQGGWQNEGNSNVSVFVHSSYPRNAVNKLQASPIADLDATSGPILGRLFVLNGDASQGFYILLPTEEPGELLLWMEGQGFKDDPNVFVYRDTSMIIERAGGATGETSRRERIRDKPPAATAEQLIEGLERFYQRELITPTVCPGGVWLRGAASKYYVGIEPERSIQKQLRTFLNGWFRKTLLAECEDTTRAGRIDIRLLRLEESRLNYWAIVELKIVKSFVHTKDARKRPKVVSPAQNGEAIAEGLRQAHEFAHERKCPPGYLEIYDLRKDKSNDPLKHGVVLIQFGKLTPQPIANVRALFGSASDARKAGQLN